MVKSAAFRRAGGFVETAFEMSERRACRALGGRPLVAPRGRATRPTSDKVREAVFGVLGSLPEVHQATTDKPGSSSSLSGHVVLDLFAGSGALGTIDSRGISSRNRASTSAVPSVEPSS